MVLGFQVSTWDQIPTEFYCFSHAQHKLPLSMDLGNTIMLIYLVLMGESCQKRNKTLFSSNKTYFLESSRGSAFIFCYRNVWPFLFSASSHPPYILPLLQVGHLRTLSCQGFERLVTIIISTPTTPFKVSFFSELPNLQIANLWGSKSQYLLWIQPSLILLLSINPC